MRCSLSPAHGSLLSSASRCSLSPSECTTRVAGILAKAAMFAGRCSATHWARRRHEEPVRIRLGYAGALTAALSPVGTTVAAGGKGHGDLVCERFEDAWIDGSAPLFLNALAAPEIPAARRAALLAELLKLERELRQKQGDRPG